MIARRKTATVVEEKPSSGRPPFTRAELRRFRQMLLDKRRCVVGDISGIETDEEGSPGLLAGERDLLREIDEALGRIDDGTYGLCQATGEPISRPRLMACPWARYCIEHARQQEKTRGRNGRFRSGPVSVWGEYAEEA